MPGHDGAMPLVLGVDSSTQSTKVEVRDADTGRARRATAARRTRRRRRRAASRIRAPGGTRSHAAVAAAGRRARRRRRRGRRPAARHGRARRRTASVVRPAKLWNDTESAPDARWLVEQLGRRGRVGRRPAARCRRRVHDHEAVVAAPLASPTRGRALARVCLPHDWLTWKLVGRVRDRPRRRVGHRLLLRRREDEYRARPARDRRRATSTGRRGCPRVLGPLEPRGHHERVRRGRGRRAGHRRQHGRRARRSGSRPGDVAISLGTSGTVFAVSEHADRRRDRARSRASPTRPAASSRSSAR